MNDYEALIALVQPIIDRTEGQVGTHSDRCYEYHVGCLAVLVKARLTATADMPGFEGTSAALAALTIRPKEVEG